MDFQVVSNKRHRPRRNSTASNSSNEGIRTQNKYRILKNREPRPTNDSDDDEDMLYHETVENPGLHTQEEQEPTQSAQDRRAGRTRIPPFILKDIAKWQTVSGELDRLRINYTKVRSVAGGLAVTPASAEDHSKLLKCFEETLIPEDDER